MSEIRVGKRTEVTTLEDADQQTRRFLCERCTRDGQPIDDFEIVFPSSKHPAFLRAMA